MSHNKSWKIRAVLTAGAAVLALSVTNGPSLAAGHEGRAAGIAAVRGGGGGAGEVRSVNERFGSMRVETLSPAASARIRTPNASAFHAAPSPTPPVRVIEPPVPPPAPTPAVQRPGDSSGPQPSDNSGGPATNVLRPGASSGPQPGDNSGPRPSMRAQSPVQDPLRPTVHHQAQQLLAPTDDVQQPSVMTRPAVQDPLRPSVDRAHPSSVKRGYPPVDKRYRSVD